MGMVQPQARQGSDGELTFEAPAKTCEGWLDGLKHELMGADEVD